MRYRETGEVHLDFYRTLNGTIAYLRQRYGAEFVEQVVRRTAREVYREIRNDLQAGDPEHLVEHWTYFLGREGGDFSVERTPEEITVRVHRCPAEAYLRALPRDYIRRE